MSTTYPANAAAQPAVQQAVDPTQMSHFRSFVNMLGDTGAKDEFKLKAAQELSENFELITQCSSYQSFLELAMRVFLKVLQDGEPMFISEFNMQQVRKLILEMIHRLPNNELVRPFVKSIIILTIKLLQTENEENVLVCLRIIVDIHKQYRPPFHAEIQDFLAYLKKIYADLPKHMGVMFEPRQPIKVKDLKELNFDTILPDIFTVTPIQLEKKTADGKTTTAAYNLIPKGINSLKVLQELPIIVVLLYQIYKQNLHPEVGEFIPLVMSTISLQPSLAHKNSPGFNKEIYVDFMGAQIKTLTFSAYILRLFPEVVNTHATTMVKGMINLLESCPKEVASLRKELLVASRHILQTEFRNHFVPMIEKLFEDDVLLGKGWTTHENLRPLAYSTLADLVHHIRQQLSLQALSKAVHLFAKNIHDESLPTSIQTMSCKLLLNLVECIRQKSEVEPVAARELMITMLRVFAIKFQTIAKLQLPQLMQKWKAKPNDGATAPAQMDSKDLLVACTVDGTDSAGQKATSIGLPVPSNLNVSEYRSLIKTLVCGVKTITWGCPSPKSLIGTDHHGGPTKLFQPNEILIFIDLFHWALETLDIYTINIPAAGMAQAIPVQKQTLQMPRSKDEKEVLEHFSGVVSAICGTFLTMDPQNFQEIFASTIDFMVDRLYKNTNLQVIANSFLANPKTSPLFATVLVEYLLERMDEMGSNIERSNLYLRLFKLVFGSVSLFAAENEHMLRPHLHNIVNRSMELAMTAKEPYNYFLLLRALFRSIGGGSHDLLYQEFLPLLPNLLEGLNRLQSGFHKQHMKDLFVELCLTVPVRLSSLLPYLPMLMDPLVSALNGSHTLISQGLRTLELCVDNLQPDFLYDHIQPVRADLMQALWRTLRNQDSAAIVAFRVLGKFGGGNRKMMIEPQKLKYQEHNVTHPAVVAYFQDHRNPINFAVDKVIETAFNALKCSTTDPFYWRQSWEVIRCYLAASITLDDDKYTLQKLFMHPSFTENNVQGAPTSSYIAPDRRARLTHQTALTGMFVAAATKELRGSVLPTMVAVVRHYTMVAIAQQAGPFPLHKHPQQNDRGMDPLVLIDALAEIMGHEEKELCKPGNLAMVLILETATNIMGSKERACRLPLMNYLGEKMAALCYERPWYSKMGGCIALKFLYQNMALRWLYQHLFVFLKAFMFIIMDLTGEVSSGAIDMARTFLEKMLRICMTPLEKDCKNEELLATQKKAMYDVIHELVRQVTSPHTLVRETAMASLRLIAELQEKTVTEVMSPHREVLVDMIPPKKHLLRHQPAAAQIGLMDGNTFCTTLEPRLFTIDLGILTHKVFYHEVLTLSDAEDATLNKLECYKTVTNLVPLRKSALNALAACHYIPNGSRDKIFGILFKALEKNNVELQEAAFQCMKNFLQGCTVTKETIHTVIRPLLLLLGDHRNLTLSGTRRLSYLTQLFPAMFNEKLCDSLLQILKKMLEVTIANNKGNFLATSKSSEMEKKIVTILGIFHQIPAASPKFIESLCKLILQAEKNLMIEPSSPYRPALVKFLLRYPKETIDLLLSDAVMKDSQWNRFTIFLLRHKDGTSFRNAAQLRGSRLTQLILLNSESSAAASTGGKTYDERYEAQHQAVLIIHTLVEYDGPWITSQVEIITALKNIWKNDLYKTCQTMVVCDLWHLIAKILIEYFSYNTNEILLLFQLLRALCLRFVPDFQFLRDFLQNTVCQSYTVEWKRKAFFQFVEVFTSSELAQDLKAKILTMIIIPSFALSFEKGEGNKLVGAPPAPYQEDDSNVVSVFINKVIDPDKPFANEDCVRIALLQFACLLVEKASPHIHDGDANNKREGNKLRRLMTFAWPCLLPKNCVDPSARYHGHLLLSHIIARLAIHKRIVLQVFHSLLKAHAVEARKVVQQALEVLTPAMPLRMEDGNTMLTHWTKKIIVEEGHSMQQLFHILQLIVRHYKVYYPVRHHLVQQMINSMHRLGYVGNTSADYRKLSIELADVIIKWEMQRVKDEVDEAAAALSGAVGEGDGSAARGDEAMDTSGAPGAEGGEAADGSNKPQASGAVKRTASGVDDDATTAGVKKKQAVGESEPQPSTSSVAAAKADGSGRPIDRAQYDTVLNFLFRMACQITDSTPSTPGIVSAGDNLSRRCVNLLKVAIKPDTPVDLKLVWLDKIFLSVETQQANIGNISTALELLTFLLGVLKKEQILNTLRPLQRGLSACVTCSNTRVIKLMHGLLSRLMAIFPTDAQHKCDELETLYSTISRMIYEGLATYEKTSQANPSSLFGTLMTLKAACSNNPGYIDRLIVPFMRLLNRLTKDHLTGFGGVLGGPAAGGMVGGGVGGGVGPGGVVAGLGPSLSDVANTSSIALELLVVSLDLVKNRVVVMSVELRKMFIGAILVGLIEKSNDSKVIKAIVKIIEEWMKSNKNTPVTVQQAPTLREKSILLVKLMQYVEKRFADDLELNGQFLELVNYIYRDEVLKATELTSKLEAAFVAGLRCPVPRIRAKFFEVFDGSMRRRLHDRLLYIICSHSWDSIGQHYWIKQCIELLILTANTTTQIQNSVDSHLLPSISSVINFADTDERKNFVIYTTIHNDSTDAFDPIEDKEDAFDMDMSVDSNISRHEESERPVANRHAALAKLISRQAEFMEANRKVRTEQLLVATAQLCHMDTQLAEKVWLDMFPKLWEVLDPIQQQSLDREIIPFVGSGAHIIQRDCNPSAMHTFVEAVAQCQPPVYLPPKVMAYLGKAHNLWHRMTLMLESLADDWANVKELLPDCVDQDDQGMRDCSIVREPLSQMYSALHEEDLWAGLWQKYAKYAETSRAIAHEQMGYFEEAQGIYDSAMTRFKQDLSNGQTPTDMNSEVQLWETHWIRCAKELNQWDILMDYGQLCRDKNTYLIMDSAWRVPDWSLMKQALLKVEQSCPKQVGYKINLYRGYLAILSQEEAQVAGNFSVERYVETASAYCMREWRRLPPIVSHIHLPILQASQQIMELQEASQIHQGLLQNRTTSLHDMKAIVKTWRNRLPVIADDLSHWSDIFTWRQHHYQIITAHLEQHNEPNSQCMLGAHASAQTIIHFGKIARKQNLTSVCQDSLSRIYTIPSVPVVDCFQKIRQQVKCCLQMASVTSRAELAEALEVIEPTNLDYFTKEMTAEFFALKGLLLAQTGRSEEANKAFSAAAQLHDTLIKAWAFWGDYLEHIFTRDYRQIHLGVSAVTCFLHACRSQIESKSRKYLAKVLWLLSYDDDKSSLLDALDKYAVGVPPGQWVPWIPQLLCSLVQYDGNVIMNLLSQVGRMFPQAVYFPIRTLYLTLKIEQRERYKSLEQASIIQQQQQQQQKAIKVEGGTVNGTPAATPGSAATQSAGDGSSTAAPGATGSGAAAAAAAGPTGGGTNIKVEPSAAGAGAGAGTATTTPIRATPPMWRCSKIMHLQRDIHPTVLSSLEGIIDQMVWFRENWYEEVLRQLRQGLTKCYAIAFDNRGAVNEATITQHTLNFIKKLVSTFGIGIENISSSVSATFASAASESLARRAQATVQDPVFQKMKGQFTSDFDFSQPGAIKLHNLIMKLKMWIKILESKTKQLPKSFLIEEKCRFLSNFSQKTAEVELPGELLLPKNSHYHIRIARFMPRVDIVQKHNTAARRLYIRGTNGKIYPYLVVNDTGIADARREERLLQLLRMLNSYLVKRKETSRRFLYLTVPRVVAVSPQMRLVEDNPASVSLLEVYKSCCTMLNMEHDAPITRYYDRLAKIQARGSPTNHVILRDILKETQAQMVPKTLLKEWAVRTFPCATDYWQFRKMFTLQLSLSCLLEYALCLTRLNPDMIYLHQDSGLMNVSYFRFEMDDSTGFLDVNRPVPFRLTPNIAEFISSVGVAGPFTASAVATARCFIQPNFKLTTILKAILKDEIIAFHKKRLIDEKVLDQSSQAAAGGGSATTASANASTGANSSSTPTATAGATGTTAGTAGAASTAGGGTSEQDNASVEIDAETVITTVSKAVSTIMGRLNNLSRIDSGESNRMSTFVHVATNSDNLCLMDPAWHPWL